MSHSKDYSCRRHIRAANQLKSSVMISIPFLPEAIRSIRPSPFVFDDVIDQLNYFLTSLLLLFCAVLVGAKQNIGSPIQCWIPKEFERAWEEYTEEYCFVESTYFIPLEMGLGHDHPEGGQKRDGARVVNYYQWVPLILVLQAAFFYFPHFVWKYSCWQSGVNVEAILQRAVETRNASEEVYYSKVRSLAHYIEDALGLQRIMTHYDCVSKHCSQFGLYMTLTYLTVKSFYLINIICQLLMIEQLFDTGTRVFAVPKFWGFRVIADLASGRGWADTGHFPRVTMCDFFVRRLGNIQHYSVQCVLMINMFNEKIYLLVWTWLCILGFATSFNLIYWIFTSMVPYKRVQFIHKYLRISHSNPDSKILDITTVRRFCSSALTPDGVLLLRFVSQHSGELLGLELTSVIWRDYLITALGLPCVAEKVRCPSRTWNPEPSLHPPTRSRPVTTEYQGSYNNPRLESNEHRQQPQTTTNSDFPALPQGSNFHKAPTSTNSMDFRIPQRPPDRTGSFSHSAQFQEPKHKFSSPGHKRYPNKNLFDMDTSFENTNMDNVHEQREGGVTSAADANYLALESIGQEDSSVKLLREKK